jgi:hypothetical protein
LIIYYLLLTIWKISYRGHRKKNGFLLPAFAGTGFAGMTILKIKMQSAKLRGRCAMEFNRPLGCARGDNEQRHNKK